MTDTNSMTPLEAVVMVLNGVKLVILSDADIIPILDTCSLRKMERILELHLLACGIFGFLQSVRMGYANYKSTLVMESCHLGILRQEGLDLLDLFNWRHE